MRVPQWSFIVELMLSSFSKLPWLPKIWEDLLALALPKAPPYLIKLTTYMYSTPCSEYHAWRREICMPKEKITDFGHDPLIYMLHKKPQKLSLYMPHLLFAFCHYCHQPIHRFMFFFAFPPLLAWKSRIYEVPCVASNPLINSSDPLWPPLTLSKSIIHHIPPKQPLHPSKKIKTAHPFA